MLTSIIHYAIKHRVWVVVATLAFVFFAVQRLPSANVDAIPDLSDTQVIIKTQYPGQPPQIVQDQVTYPLTSALMSVPGAKTVRGFSFFGDSFVYVIFDDNTDIYWARSRVLEYLSQAKTTLPQGVEPQLGPDASGVGWVYIYALRDKTGRYDLSQLRRLQDWTLKFELQAVPGVAEVATAGGMVEQYQVIIDPMKLRAYRLTLDAVTRAIQAANQTVGASVIEMAEAEYMVMSSGYIKTLNDLNDIPLGTDAQGVPLRLADIAEVKTGPQARRVIAELDGEGETVGGIVVMRHNENAQKVIEGVKQALQRLQAQLPEGVEIVTVYDRSRLISASVQHLLEKLWQELALVAVVCAVFLLHVRSSLVAIITLPLGILVAVVLMQWQGITANIMSLGGIAIAIGAMTDGAIVMIENMHKHMARGNDTPQQRWQLVARASTEVAPAVFYSLLIITVSFLPVFMLEAQEGKLFTPLAFTKSYAMAAAAGLSVTLVPVLMGYFVRGRVINEHANPINRGLNALYQPLLMAAMRRPKTTVILAAFVTLLGLAPATTLDSEFMPTVNEGDLMYMPTTYAGISIGKAREILQQTNQQIASFPEVETVFGKVGRANTATDPAPLTMIETFIQLKPPAQWRTGMTLEKLTQEMDKRVNFPGLSNAWVMPIKTRIDMLSTGVKTPLGLRISGQNPAILEDIGQRVEALLSTLPGTASAYAERAAAGRYISIDVNRANAARFALNVADVQGVIASAIGGRDISWRIDAEARFPINVRYPENYRDSVEALNNLPIVTPKGAVVTLAEVADISIHAGPPALKSENARLASWVLLDITSDTSVSEYRKAADTLIQQQLTLPEGYSLSWTGQFEAQQRVAEKMNMVIPLTVLIIIALLFMYFRRWRDVGLMLCTLPIGLTGGVCTMYLMGFKWSVATIVGFVALAGVAIETGILMLAYLRLANTAHDANHYISCLTENACQRVRPVVMTATTLIVGLLPVLMAEGVGSEIMRRIAAPMVGGMLSVLVLTLLILPPAYAILNPIRRD